VGELSASPQKDAILGEKTPFCRKEGKDCRSQGRTVQVFKTLISTLTCKLGSQRFAWFGLAMKPPPRSKGTPLSLGPGALTPFEPARHFCRTTADTPADQRLTNAAVFAALVRPCTGSALGLVRLK